MNEVIKQQEPQDNGALLCVSGSIDLTGTIETTSAITIGRATTNTTIWKGGYVTDNFHSYYLDENMVKHFR